MSQSSYQENGYHTVRGNNTTAKEEGHTAVFWLFCAGTPGVTHRIHPQSVRDKEPAITRTCHGNSTSKNNSEGKKRTPCHGLKGEASQSKLDWYSRNFLWDAGLERDCQFQQELPPFMSETVGGGSSLGI